MSRGRGKMRTYEVDFRRMEQLLLSIGTCRRICKSQQKHPISGSIHTDSYHTARQKRGGAIAIPGDKVLSNTWVTFILP